MPSAQPAPLTQPGAEEASEPAKPEQHSSALRKVHRLGTRGVETLAPAAAELDTMEYRDQRRPALRLRPRLDVIGRGTFSSDPRGSALGATYVTKVRSPAGSLLNVTVGAFPLEDPPRCV